MDNDEIETLEGSFKKTIFRSANYMVSVFDSNDGPITVTGPSFDYDKDSKYTLVGKYVDHPKYGFQFEMISVSKFLPSAKEEIIKYLSSSIFKKVGTKAAEKIYAVYGDDSLRILKKDSSAINDVNISNIQKKSIIEVFSKESDDLSESVFKLISLGYSSKDAHLILSFFKEELIDVLNSNPYRFYIEVYGISFNKVVESTKKLDFVDKELKYKEALLVYLFKDISFRLGDTFLEYTDFSKSYFKYYDDLDDIIELALKDKYLIKKDSKYYLARDYYDEKFIANYLNREKDNPFNVDDINIDIAIKDLEQFENIEYDLKQIKAIKNFFNNNYSLIVGGPGTGKTTIIKAMVNLFTNFFEYSNIVVIAPTGRAAKRINEICSVPSKTIHSLLRWNKDDNTFAFNEDNPLLYDAIIIDEFSMVDSNLFASLLRASSHVSKICIIGDDNQLPSIRQGNVLYDLINSKKFPLIRLTSVHRQKEGNDIIQLANDIVTNSVNFDSYTNDVCFIDIKNFDKTKLVDLINTNIDIGYDFENIQILSPMYRGEFGIDALNLSLQSSFNPKSEDKIERRIANCLYRETDKILQLKNRPDDDVYNGDIGNLEEIDVSNRTFLINYNGVYIYYSFDDLIDISLAYALSVHKAQGSEYDIVYFICSKEHSIMLYKKLVYTAISRAKSKLVIIGDKDTFINATKKESRTRKTTLIDRLTDCNYAKILIEDE